MFFHNLLFLIIILEMDVGSFMVIDTIDAEMSDRDLLFSTFYMIIYFSSVWLESCDIWFKTWQVVTIKVCFNFFACFFIDTIERVSLHVIIDVISIIHLYNLYNFINIFINPSHHLVSYSLDYLLFINIKFVDNSD